ncbi:hypothetical protein HYR99_38530 [Candidatus Poribacteria bacterium]|nr:hypothetical protein [Candidatus Poribacteria bacterium]
MRSVDPFIFKRRRTRKKIRCRTCRSDNGKRMCPALNLLICPECCRAKRAKIPGCDQQCRYYTPLIYVGKINPPPDFPIYQCLVSKSKDSGMLTVIVARERCGRKAYGTALLMPIFPRQRSSISV